MAQKQTKGQPELILFKSKVEAALTMVQAMSLMQQLEAWQIWEEASQVFKDLIRSDKQEQSTPIQLKLLMDGDAIPSPGSVSNNQSDTSFLPCLEQKTLPESPQTGPKSKTIVPNSHSKRKRKTAQDKVTSTNPVRKSTRKITPSQFHPNILEQIKPKVEVQDETEMVFYVNEGITQCVAGEIGSGQNYHILQLSSVDMQSIQSTEKPLRETESSSLQRDDSVSQSQTEGIQSITTKSQGEVISEALTIVADTNVMEEKTRVLMMPDGSVVMTIGNIEADIEGSSPQVAAFENKSVTENPLETSKISPSSTSKQDTSQDSTEIVKAIKPYSLVELNASSLSSEGTSAKKSQSQTPRSRECKCKVCGRKFTHASNLSVHMRIHSGDRPFACKFCGQRFTTGPNQRRHERSHLGEKPYPCPTCGKRFTEKKSMMTHTRTHTGEKPYQCKTCDACFSQQATLTSHMHTHTGWKGHLCVICGRAFRQKSQLTVHMRRHSGMKNYKCDTCSKAFYIKGDLDRHNLQHTGERPFLCQHCPRTFTRLQYLKEHTNIHTGQKPFKCKDCGESFREQASLSRHYRKHGYKPTSHVPLILPVDAEQAVPKLVVAANAENGDTAAESGEDHTYIILEADSQQVLETVSQIQASTNQELLVTESLLVKNESPQKATPPVSRTAGELTASAILQSLGGTDIEYSVQQI